jgi:hypothetical protein
MLLIAGSPVALGDSLWITKAQAYGLVSNIGQISCSVTVTRNGSARVFRLEQGGVDSQGERIAYWFGPIVVDLPKGDGARRNGADAIVQKIFEVLP